MVHDYATIASLSLQIVLKDTLEGAFPEWAGLQDTINAARWVSGSLDDMSREILKEFGENESVCVQERNV